MKFLLFFLYSLFMPFLSFSQNIDWNKHQLFPVKSNGGINIYDLEGNIVYEYKNAEKPCVSICDDFEKIGYIPIEQNGSIGVINQNSTEIIPLGVFSIDIQIWNTSNTDFVFYVEDLKTKKHGILDSLGNVLIPIEYEEIIQTKPFSNIFYVRNPNGTNGFVDSKNSLISKTNYINADYGWLWMWASYIFGEKDGILTIYDNKGKLLYADLILPPIENINSDNYYVLERTNGNWISLRKDGKITELGKCEYITKVRNTGKAVICKENRHAIIDLNSGKLTSAWYKKISYLDDFVAIVAETSVKNKNVYTYFLMTPTGRVIAQYDLIEGIGGNGEKYVFPCGLCLAKSNDKYGFIDNKGKVMIPFQYNNAENFTQEGYALVRKNEKIGLIDAGGNFKVSIDMDKGYPFLYEYGIHSLGNNRYKIFKRHSGDYIIDGANNILYKNIKYAKRINADLLYIVDEENCCKAVDNNGKDIVLSIKGEDMFDLKLHQYLFSLEKSDVDINIPNVNINNDKSFVLIIANEKYNEADISKVAYAHNDGKIFMEYCKKVLGVSNQNIKLIQDATINNMRMGLNWLNDRACAFDGQANIIVYYSGHGIPDEHTNQAYLLPSDGIANDYRSAFSIADMYKQLGDMPTKLTTVFLDACFSGTSKEGNMLLKDSKGVIVKSKQASPKGNMVVLAAAQGNETAFSYKKKKHSMFTYFLLKKLQETKGEVSLGDLGTYINKQVRQNSIVENGKIQTPTISVSDKMSLIWKNLKIK